MPTLGEVMDNLGQPMDFVEYRIDDDEGDQGDVDVHTEQDNIAGSWGETHTDVEGARLFGSGASGMSSADVCASRLEVLEVCHVVPHAAICVSLMII